MQFNLSAANTQSRASGSCLSDVNSLVSRQKIRHFADDISKCSFLNENKTSLKYVAWDLIDNKSAFFQ